MTASEKRARSEAYQLAMWLAPFDHSRSLDSPAIRELGPDEIVDKAVGNDFATDGSALPDLGPLSKLGTWANVAAVLDRKALQLSGFNPASTIFNELQWEDYLYRFSTMPFFSTTSNTTRESSISSLSLAGAVNLITDLVENIVTKAGVNAIITSVKKIAEVAMTNEEKTQKDNYQKQGVISIKDNQMTMGFLKVSVEMKYVKGKGYEQLTQIINVYQFVATLDFAKCIRSADSILSWDQTDVDEWTKATSSYPMIPNESPAWTKS